MAVPTYEDAMLPFLKLLSDGKVRRMEEIRSELAEVLELSDDDLASRLPSGGRRYNNRIGWTRTHLNKAGLIESEKRGHWGISEQGQALLAENPSHIDCKLLERYESFREFQKGRPKENELENPAEVVTDSSATPEEVIDAAYERHRKQLQEELLDTLKNTSPFFFEKVVLQLLRAMGYGGVTGTGLVTPKSSDGGIDGIIYEDKLGLDTVVIQAKRWEGTVGRQTVQAFVGSMDLHRSRKGVVLTTGCYSRDAESYIDRIEGKKVVLIDGDELTALMIDYQVGVTPTKTYELVDVSQDFFDEDG